MIALIEAGEKAYLYISNTGWSKRKKKFTAQKIGHAGGVNRYTKLYAVSHELTGMNMPRQLVLLLILLIAGCSSSSVLTSLERTVTPTDESAETKTLSLVLTGVERDGFAEVVLETHDAQDLYQIAGAITYDPTRYAVEDVNQGGGLGEPASTYFAWGERQPGRIEFGYTKRYRGAGSYGTAQLLKLTVTPQSGLMMGDFALDTRTSQLLARDSLKHEIAVSINDGGTS